MRSFKNATPPFVNTAVVRFVCDGAVHIRQRSTSPHPETPESGLPRARNATLNALLLLVLLLSGASSGIAGIQGVPFSRTYSLDEIGYVSRGSRLNFDSFGHIAVIHDGVYAVLNDTTWINVADTDEATRTPMTE